MSNSNLKGSDRTNTAQLSKIYMLKKLREQYGNVDLKTLLKKVKGDKVHKCPNCDGKGTTTEMKWLTSYDGDMPYDETRICYVCKGLGYTQEEKKPKYKQDGWV